MNEANRFGIERCSIQHGKIFYWYVVIPMFLCSHLDDEGECQQMIAVGVGVLVLIGFLWTVFEIDPMKLVLGVDRGNSENLKNFSGFDKLLIQLTRFFERRACYKVKKEFQKMNEN